jgi:type VI protein secretion system component Hcp
MTEIFVKVEGVTGTGTGLHQGWLPMQSAMLLTPRKTSITVSREPDQASTRLFRMAMDGTGLKTVTFDFVKDGRTVTRLELGNVLILEYHPPSGLRPVESMVFEYMEAKLVLGVNQVGHVDAGSAAAGAAARKAAGRYWK